jgi:hypothetical protein
VSPRASPLTMPNHLFLVELVEVGSWCRFEREGQAFAKPVGGTAAVHGRPNLAVGSRLRSSRSCPHP